MNTAHRKPANAPAVESLMRQGIVAWQQGQRKLAADLIARATTLDPDNAEAHKNLGVVLLDLRRIDDAIACQRRAIALRPDYSEAHYNLGNALRELGQLDAAATAFRAAIASQADLYTAHLNLGQVLRLLGRKEDAMQAYRQVLALRPDLADAHNNMGTLLLDMGRLDEALSCYRRALELDPASALASYNAANILKEKLRWDEAATLYRKAVAMKPDFAEAHNNLALVLKDQGRLLDAIASFGAAVRANPGYLGAHSNLLLTLNYMEGVSQDNIYRAHRDFGVRIEAPYIDQRRRHDNAADPERRLRIGYLSPDFRHHACACFLEPLFDNHDHARHEIHGYADVTAPDAVTERLRGTADSWHDLVGKGDDAVAAAIRTDGIDILVDLAGHTADNRLAVFARKPAPVQITWLGYPATTGLTAMDYRFTDCYCEPPGTSEAYYTETLIRLPNSLWCYQPPADMPDPGPLPALANGHLTFGSFNNFAKVGPAVIGLWARLLREIPDARIAIVCASEGAMQERVRTAFAEHGIDPARLELHGRLPRSEYLALHRRVDLALDPFPCNGGATTCDALWMGVPVLTLIGNTFLSRAGYSLLSSAGLAEFAAASADDLVANARNMSLNPQYLAGVRANMRERVAASPLTDARQFSADVEAAYRQVWQQWCAAGKNG